MKKIIFELCLVLFVLISMATTVCADLAVIEPANEKASGASIVVIAVIIVLVAVVAGIIIKKINSRK